MHTRPLGSTGIRISAIGLGCWAIGGPSFEEHGKPSGWADVDEEEAARAIRVALDGGVTHFDTADVYGNGRSERLLGRALANRSNEVVVASKVGYLRGSAEHPYDPTHIRHQCEQSLRNLRRECIDIYYFHHADFGPKDCRLGDAVDEMNRLREQGKIRCVGLSAYAVRDFVRLAPVIQPSVLQSWAHAMDHHFIDPNSPVMKLCAQFGCSFVAFSPLNQGIMLDKYLADSPPVFAPGDHRASSEKFKAPYLARAGEGLRLIKERFGARTEDLVRVAVRFVLAHEHVAGAIPGFRSVDQVRMNLAADAGEFSPDDVAFVREAFARSREPRNRGVDNESSIS